MKLRTGIFYILILLTGIISQSYSQQFDFPSLVLENVEFHFSASGLPEELDSLEINLTDGEKHKNYTIPVNQGVADTGIIIEGAGKFKINFSGFPTANSEIRSIPGLLSIIPPLVAILLALILRQVIVSLLLGVYIGAIFVYDYNPFIAILRVIDSYIINAVAETSHVQIIVFTLLFGGIIGLISKSGGTQGIANVITSFAKTRRSGMISTWLSGLLIFFDDYANSLIVGNLMRPVSDKMKISRAKLAFIVDATAAPVSSLVIISSWIGYEVGLIQSSLQAVGSVENAYDIFIKTIPYRFYPIAMLIFVFLISYFQRDFGPMRRAERERMSTRDDTENERRSGGKLSESSELFGNEERAKWYNGIIPILVIVIGTVLGLYFTGVSTLKENGITDYNLSDIIGNSDSYLALLWGSFSATLVAAVMILSQRIMTVSETVDAWFIGIRSMLLAVIILSLAWAIGNVTYDVKTADYIVSMLSESINPYLLPVIVFIACAMISFATGTSWGTMAIMMPIVIPLAVHVSGIQNLPAVESRIILYGVISSVLTGCVFGDHCSPISDTTILSSMASGCDHIEHVKTQLPYALVVGVICMLIGDIPTAYGLSPYISLLLITILLTVILLIFGKKTSTGKSL
ncbi:MAG: Na+/H+ antiporter NhaC family protein [Ignavibacteriaceae bacterium]